MSWFTSLTESVSKIAKDVGENLTLENISATATEVTTGLSKYGEFLTEAKDDLLGTGSKNELSQRKQEQRARVVKQNPFPWKTYNVEQDHLQAELKTRVVKLSESEDTFLFEAPDENVFIFELEAMLPFALAALKEDEQLTKKRYELVPKKIIEEDFWRNYFYRVSLVRAQIEVCDLTPDLLKLDVTDVDEEPEKEIEQSEEQNSDPQKTSEKSSTEKTSKPTVKHQLSCRSC